MLGRCWLKGESIRSLPEFICFSYAGGTTSKIPWASTMIFGLGVVSKTLRSRGEWKPDIMTVSWGGVQFRSRPFLDARKAVLCLFNKSRFPMWSNL